MHHPLGNATHDVIWALDVIQAGSVLVLFSGWDSVMMEFNPRDSTRFFF